MKTPPLASNVEFNEDHITYATSRLLDIAVSAAYNCRLEEKEVTNSQPQSSYSEFQEDAMEYFAGYIAYACKRKHNMMLGDITRRVPVPSNSWLHQLSRGGLMAPSDSLIHDVKRCESSFQRRFMVQNLVRKAKVTAVVFKTIKTDHPDIDDRVILEYTLVRIKIRINFINLERKHNSRWGMKPRNPVASTLTKNQRKTRQFIRSK
ncbi:unnamed protein product [Orchesella dallaii]|uniref:Uncharacterized protein n=1 Tax=Orchesella dallaii TaxID=48710 RepID=A0ABP1R2C4_9HEXA